LKLEANMAASNSGAIVLPALNIQTVTFMLVGEGTADIRYRPEFKQWKMPVTLKFNAAVISVEQIANLLNTAGFGVGIGEWRPEKNGSYGRFHVGSEGE
jgi:hypothetical protein